MSTRTHFTGITKRVVVIGGATEELIFNNPFDANACKIKMEDGGPDLVVNQTFNAIRIDSIGGGNGFVTFYKGIAPSPTAEDNVILIRPFDGIYHSLSVSLIKIYSVFGGIYTLTLYI